MDRDKRWERVKIAVDGLVSGVGEKTDDPIKTIEENYKKDVTDEFLKPIICGPADSRIQSEWIGLVNEHGLEVLVVWVCVFWAFQVADQ